MVTEKEKDIELDQLVAARINQEIPIADGQGIEYHLITPDLTSKAVEFISNLASTYGIKTLGEINFDDIDVKNGIAKNPKALAELLVEKLKELQSEFPNLSPNEILRYVTAHAGTVKVEEEKIEAAAKEQAEKNIEAAKQAFTAMFALGGAILACELSGSNHDFAAGNSGFVNAGSFFGGILNKDKSILGHSV